MANLSKLFDMVYAPIMSGSRESGASRWTALAAALVLIWWREGHAAIALSLLRLAIGGIAVVSSVAAIAVAAIVVAVVAVVLVRAGHCWRTHRLDRRRRQGGQLRYVRLPWLPAK